MREFGKRLEPLPAEPVLSDFYTLSDEQHYQELAFHHAGHDQNWQCSILSRGLKPRWDYFTAS